VPAKLSGQRFHRKDIRQVALVELQEVGDFVEVVAVLFQVGHQIVQRFGIGVHAFLLRVGHEDDAVHATQDEFAAGVIKNLAGDGIEVNTRLETTHRTEVEGKEVKKQGPLGLGGERDHLALLLLGGLLVDMLQVGGFAAKARAVIHNLAINLAGCEVDIDNDFAHMPDVRDVNTQY